jgi:glycerol uptake facilitator-like aquaporin
VTLATIITGHISIGKGIMYIFFQVSGSVLGSLILVGLITPTVEVGNAILPSGCFGKSDINGGQLFGWELIMTFVLVRPRVLVSIPDSLSFPLSTVLAHESTLTLSWDTPLVFANLVLLLVSYVGN